MLEMVLSFLAEIGLLITQKLIIFLKKRIASAVSVLITDNESAYQIIFLRNFSLCFSYSVSLFWRTL